MAVGRLQVRGRVHFAVGGDSATESVWVRGLPSLRMNALGQSATRNVVVVVDDDHDAANSLSMVLKGCGYVVETAYNGQDALRLTELLSPMAVVSDIEMPGMSGIEAAEAVLELPLLRKPCLVAVSGAMSPQLQLAALEAGFDRFLAKPIRLDALLEVLERYCPS